MKNFNVIILILVKNLIFRGGGRGCMKKQLFWGEWFSRLKRGLGEFADLRGGLAKKKIRRGEVFEVVAEGEC